MKRRLLLNTLTPVLLQFITICCGLILPRLYLSAYGSEVNGIVSSISQFLSVISLLDMGVSSVVQAAFYKPLADKDTVRVSEIYVSSMQFFRKIAYAFAVYIIFVIAFFSFKSSKSLDVYEIIILTIIISSSLFVQYFFGLTNQILLNSDQYIYIQTGLQCILLIVNLCVCYIMIGFGFGIIAVRGISAIIFILRPIFLQIYVKHHYRIDYSIQPSSETIKQKWDGASQFIANFVLTNTDVIVLTFFSTFENVSVYTVYNNVAYGLRQLVMAFGSGFQSLWGNLLANKKNNELLNSFDFFEWILHNMVTIIFASAMMLIVPFVELYTKGINDVDYLRPVFGMLIIAANAASCYRLPYISLIYAAGQFKETQVSAWIETTINLIISVFLVWKLELIGVAIGTLISMLYRTVYLAFYLRKRIIERSFKFFLKRVFLDVIIGLVIFGISNFLVFERITIVGWIIYAIQVFGIASVSMIVVNIIFDKQRLIKYSKKIIKKQ